MMMQLVIRLRRMTAEIQGIKMAIRNAADAQALLVAEGATEEIQTMLLRLRELAVQLMVQTRPHRAAAV